MEGILSLLFAAVVGFVHVFEADHLVAVSSLVTKRKSTAMAVKDGMFWGMGHTTMIFIIGAIIIVGKATFLNGYFGYFEAIVGLMLILLGVYRLYEYISRNESTTEGKVSHQMAYGVGLIHGLAGSGAMVLLVLAEIEEAMRSMIYLLIFGIGSIIGMFVVAGILSMPFTQKVSSNKKIHSMLIILSSMICILYGGFVVFKNLS